MPRLYVKILLASKSFREPLALLVDAVRGPAKCRIYLAREKFLLDFCAASAISMGMKCRLRTGEGAANCEAIEREKFSFKKFPCSKRFVFHVLRPAFKLGQSLPQSFPPVGVLVTCFRL